ncbi:hypothetical protein CYMTET_34983 [Cymbomonas tetramitiformis]|uniref:Uncharacterized protein n=1 Tax=Cymbomonas tetramitiformis TaxID=36881 RepID=A0AAE0KPF1_9CHLO|nr:hypothetical protein CYMTET_34983 [Cymbomonas tetramitiformis]
MIRPGPEQKAVERMRRAMRWLKRTHPVTVVAPGEAEPDVAPAQASTPTEVGSLGGGKDGDEAEKGSTCASNTEAGVLR